MIDQQRITRITFPTASFSLENRHIKWITAEAKRRNVAKSVVVRQLLDRFIAEKSSTDEEDRTAAA